MEDFIECFESYKRMRLRRGKDWDERNYYMLKLFFFNDEIGYIFMDWFTWLY